MDKDLDDAWKHAGIGKKALELQRPQPSTQI